MALVVADKQGILHFNGVHLSYEVECYGSNEICPGCKFHTREWWFKDIDSMLQWVDEHWDLVSDEATTWTCEVTAVSDVSADGFWAGTSTRYFHLQERIDKIRERCKETRTSILKGEDR